MPLTTRAKMPSFSLGSAAALADPKQNPYNFSGGLPSAAQAAAVLSALKSKGAKKVGIIGSNDAAGVAIADLFNKFGTQLGLQMVGTELFSPGTADLTVQVQKLKSAGADGLAAHAVGADNGAITKGVRDVGWTDVTIVGDASSLTGDLTKTIPAEVQGQFFSIQNRGVVRKGDTTSDIPFATKAVKAGKPASLALAAEWYDLTYLMKWGVEKAGSTDGDKVKAALETASTAKDLPSNLVYYKDVTWSPTSHAIDLAAWEKTWALVQVSKVVDGTYQGTPFEVEHVTP
jgi:branched-chain amino acid transport system substrate-binding protein